MEKRKPLCTVGGKLVQPLWKTAWRALKKLKIQLLMTQKFRFWVYTQEK